MITTNLTGNLGNHMWLYSICRVVAEKLNFEWGINPSPTHDYHNGMNQMYFMDIDFGKKVTVNGKNTKGLNTYVGINNEYYDTPKHHSYNGDNCLINMYDPNVFNISDNSMIHLISQSENYLIDRKNDICDWFKIKPEFKKKYDEKLNKLNISLDDNTCVINFRGGEYRGVPNLIPDKDYWSNCIKYMLSLNNNMKFIIVSDDPSYAEYYIGNYPCYHDEIGFDFYVINQSKYKILSNSSFGWWASWLNDQSSLVLAPKYWGRYNVSNGYWSLGDQYTKNFSYMGKDGVVYSYEECKKQAEEFYKINNLL